MSTRLASTLAPGDVFEFRGTTVVVLEGPSEGTDRFGRPMLVFRCRRDDTGAEGQMDFGPGGVVSTTGGAS